MRAIWYFRSDGDAGSRAKFEAAFQEYCDLNLHQAFKSFEDVGDSEDSGRLGYQRMLEFMRESGSSFLVVVPDARHLGADLEAVARAMVELEGTGAKVACAEEELPDPLQNALHNLGIKGVSRTRSERIKESMRAKALKGQGLGRPPYGYRNGSAGILEIVSNEAPVAELIYRLYTRDGLGLRLIAGHLNERSIPTRRGGRWNIVTIRDILRNPTYVGTYTRFGFRLPKTHEPIIPGEVFRAAQDRMRTRRPIGRVVSAEPFLLSGLVTCGHCGNKMMGVTRRQSWRRKDHRRLSGVYRYYQCQSRNNQSVCGYHTWRASLLEGSVLGQLRHALRANGGAPAGSGAPSPGSRLKNAERRFLQAMKRAARGKLSVARLQPYLHELDRLRAIANRGQQPVDVEATLGGWESLDISQQQTFLADHVAGIVVTDDTVEVRV